MLTVYPIPALKSNYFWLLQPLDTHPAAYILDPGDAAPVIATLEKYQLKLSGIIITHHHWDHTDGIDELLARFPVPVYGPDSPKIPQVTHILYHGSNLCLPYLSLEVIGVPGHTLDHIAYVDKASKPWKLFCGDSLFAGGCGRMFEGQPKQMWESLKKLAALPESTLVYCSHEYTQTNLHFAVKVEPDNQELKNRLKTVNEQRKHQQSTLPSTIGMENRTNPFLRCHLSSVRQVVERHQGQSLGTDDAVFAALRTWKDQD